MIKAKSKITAIHLNLELKDEYLSDYQKRMLKRYGESSNGDSISRDILIPSDMPLHNLHYVIQKLFGWQNSHLRKFYLPEDRYNEITCGTVKGWSELVGILFQPPSEAEEDIFWDDDYKRGSINVWLRKKYTGPYKYGGTMEHIDIAQQDVQDLLNYFEMVDVKESFSEYLKRSRKDDKANIRILKKAPLIELTLEEMHSSIYIEGGTESLLERLEVDKVIAAKGEEISSDGVFPVTNTLIYNYDFGDNWEINITKLKDCDDLIEKNLIDKDELEEAQFLVTKSYRPVCIHKDGLSVLDDVGGLSGYAEFLGVLYEGEDKEESSSIRKWAKGLGWSDKKVSINTIL